MATHEQIQAAKAQANADSNRVIELRAKIEFMQVELAQAVETFRASMTAAAALMAEAVGEHEIGYAYASSDIAEKAKKPNGCHYLKIGAKVTGVFDSYAEAVLASAEAGTAPSRWSKDHPDNAKFLRGTP